MTCHGVSRSTYTLRPDHSLVNAHCSETLVWSEVSEFCNTINTGPSLRFLLEILLFPQSHGDPEALVLQDQPLHKLQQLIGGVDVVVGQIRAQDLGLPGQPTSSPLPSPMGPALLKCPGEGQGQLSHTYAMKSRASSPECSSC